VVTVEPGIYVRAGDVEASDWFRALTPEDRARVGAAARRYDGIGVRIEDDFAVSTRGARCLSCAAPRTAAEVEAWQAGGGGR
jgi:Xaa-Pro aminopeptidase